MVSTVIQAGKYRHRVTIQKPIQVQDTTGSVIPTWIDVAFDVRVSIDFLNGREMLLAQQVQADVTTAIAMRWRPGIDASMRILHESYEDSSPPEVDVYNIEYITKDTTGRKEIICYCRARMNEGFRTDG